MRQRVMIAMALSCDPDVIVADEPTTALDVMVQAQMLELLSQARREQDLALILITHDLGVVSGAADEVAVMYGGRIVERAPTRDLLRDASHPYTIALLRAVPRIHGNVDRLEAIPGQPGIPAGGPNQCYFSPRCPLASHTEGGSDKARPALTQVAQGHHVACHLDPATVHDLLAKRRNDPGGVSHGS
jgi:oligopeptide/dipeptide ABC transporter ATP-binding protein